MGEPAEEESVDGIAERGQQARARRTAVDHERAGAIGDGVAQREGHRPDVLDGRRLGRADRPDRLVGDDERAVGRAGEGVAQLRDRARGGFGGSTRSSSPMHSTGRRPLRSAAAVFARTTSSVSPNSRRRSAWPISTTPTPTSASSAGLTSPVNGPESSAAASCAPTIVAGSGERLERRADLQVGRDDEELDASVDDGGVPRGEFGDAREPLARLAMTEVHLEAHADGTRAVISSCRSARTRR